MATKKKTPVKSPKIVNQKPMEQQVPREIQNEMNHMIKNGLNEAILGFNPASVGTQLNQVTTLFINNRWYLISNMRQIISESYVEHGLIQTVVDVPVDDGLRGGIEIKSQQLGEDEIKELQIWLEREDVLSSVVGQGLKWNRLFGGAGILIMTDQDPETPLDLNTINENTPLEFRAVDMWELFWDKQNTEGYDPEIQTQKFSHYNYYAKKIHKSRVLVMKGLTPPSFIRPRLRGWGFSILEVLINSINQYLKSNNLSFEVLDEFKIDVYKIKNLTSTLLSPGGTAAVQQRVQIANQQKNYQNAITMDSEDDWDHKQLTFAGLAEMMKEFRMQIASDLRMPLTKIFGISAAGFSSGEDDIENYNGMVEAQVRAKCKHHILKIIELKCQQRFGMVPDDLQINFKPLRVLSAEQEENVKTQKFNRLLQNWQAGGMTDEEYKDACNKENLLCVQLDTSIEKLVTEDMADEDKSEDDADGANREDSQKREAVTKPPAKKAFTTPKESKPAKNAK